MMRGGGSAGPTLGTLVLSFGLWSLGRLCLAPPLTCSDPRSTVARPRTWSSPGPTHLYLRATDLGSPSDRNPNNPNAEPRPLLSVRTPLSQCWFRCPPLPSSAWIPHFEIRLATWHHYPAPGILRAAGCPRASDLGSTSGTPHPGLASRASILDLRLALDHRARASRSRLTS